MLENADSNDEARLLNGSSIELLLLLSFKLKNARHAPQLCVRLCAQKSLGYKITAGNFHHVHMYVL